MSRRPAPAGQRSPDGVFAVRSGGPLREPSITSPGQMAPQAWPGSRGDSIQSPAADSRSAMAATCLAPRNMVAMRKRRREKKCSGAGWRLCQTPNAVTAISAEKQPLRNGPDVHPREPPNSGPHQRGHKSGDRIGAPHRPTAMGPLIQNMLSQLNDGGRRRVKKHRSDAQGSRPDRQGLREQPQHHINTRRGRTPSLFSELAASEETDLG